MTPTQAERAAWLIQDVAVCVREHDEVRGIHARNELIRLLTTQPPSPAPADSEAVRLLREWRRWIENSNFIDAPSPISETRAYLASVDGQKEPG